jgi:transcriptional regulator with XRE-family HTH domain
VGRRILERRHELNLSLAQLAERTGMAPDYLEYLESSPTAEPSSATLARTALALETSASDLLGGDHGRPDGQSAAGEDPHLVEINDAECRDLLAGGGVGRVIFRAKGRPVAFPVNFKPLKGDVIFRSSDDGDLSAIAFEEPVSFEVDRMDDVLSEGWSVLATGTVHPIRAADQLKEVEALGIEPWAGGDRHTYFRLAVTQRSGRRINTAR